MKFRCPYCAFEFEGAPRSTCPGCRRAMALPGRLRKSDREARRRALQRIERDAERARRGMGTALPDLRIRKPWALLVVLAMMVLLGGALIRQTDDVVARRDSRRNPHERTRRDLATLARAIENFRTMCYRYPTESEGLMALVRNPGIATWERPFVNFIRSDGWRRPYRYRATHDTFVLYSVGPDGIDGTGDDIHPPPPGEFPPAEASPGGTPADPDTVTVTIGRPPAAP